MSAPEISSIRPSAELVPPLPSPSSSRALFDVKVEEIEDKDAEAVVAFLQKTSFFQAKDKDPETIEKIFHRIATSEGLEVDCRKFAVDFINYWTLCNAQSSLEVPKKRRQAAKNCLNNRMKFIAEVINNLEKDKNLISQKFNFDSNQVKNIYLAPAPGDLHNKGKSPIFITFILLDGREIKIVYKPRVMQFEKAVCDTTEGIFSEVNQYFKSKGKTTDMLKTYPVAALEDRSYSSISDRYGYSQFVNGNPICDENGFSSNVLFNFIVNNDRLKDIRMYLNIVLILEKDKHGLLLKIVDNFSILDQIDAPSDQEEFFNQVQELKNRLGNYGLKILKTQSEFIKNPVELAKLSYFWKRSQEQLESDIWLFAVLARLGVTDLHAGNFLDDEVGPLAAVDVEAFDDPNSLTAKQIFNMAVFVYEQKKFDQTEDIEFTENVEQHFQKINEMKNSVPFRYLPITTGDFYLLCREYLLEKNIKKNCDQYFENIQNKGFVFEISKDTFQQLIESNFDQVDIPIFLISRDNSEKKLTLLLNGKKIASKPWKN